VACCHAGAVVVSFAGGGVRGLPDALDDGLAGRLSGRRLALFFDCDGTLTPIVARSDDAVISSGPLYVGDDITDEDAFAALRGRGVGILVADLDDPELAGRTTRVDYVLRDAREVELFLGAVGR
jgi:trehalose-6-phosphatase